MPPRVELPSVQDLERWRIIKPKIDDGADGPEALWNLLSKTGPLAVHRHVVRRVDGDLPPRASKVYLYERFVARLRRGAEVGPELAATLEGVVV